MKTLTSSVDQSRHRVEWDGSVLELVARRAGLRTAVVLLRDGQPVGEGTGTGRVLLPVPQQAAGQTGEREAAAQRLATVLTLSVWPGRISRAFLLVPKPEPVKEAAPEDGNGSSSGAGDQPGEGGQRAAAQRRDAALGEVLAELPKGVPELPKGVAELAGFARAERHPFEPPPGTLAARLLTVQRKHPRLYASRHVALAVGKVVLGVLGVALFVQLVLQHVIGWIVERLPHVDLPSVRWPDISVPSLPLPDVDWPGLPDVSLPGWLLAVAATAKYWVPILIAIGLAVREARKRTRRTPDAAGRDPGTDPSTDELRERQPHDAHR